MSKRLTVGSTFTGIGGADLGFEWAGFDIKWQCEFDSWKQEVLRAHWADVPLYDDITTMNDAPSVDVMLGGFPCQDLSVAGKRKGFSGERSVLAFEFLRVAELVQPRWIVLENVPGLLSSNGGRDFARLVDEVVGCGYGVAWRILDARYFGVPQRRRRVFIVARRTDAKYDSRSASRLALRALFESSGGDTSSGWQAWTETPRSVGSSSPSGSGIAGSLTKRYAKGINTTCDDGAMVIESKDKMTDGGGATRMLRVSQVKEGSKHD
jgi:DNA-cytosine methyltransferase